MKCFSLAQRSMLLGGFLLGSFFCRGFFPQELALKVNQRALRPRVSPGSPTSTDNGWDWGLFDLLPPPSLKRLKSWVWLPRHEEELSADSEMRDLLNDRLLEQTGEGLVPTEGWPSWPSRGR